MINKLKNWFSKRGKRPTSDIDNSVAFVNITVDAEQGLTLTSDFIDGHEQEMSHLVFLLCSGALMDMMGNVVEQRCGKDTKKRDLILSEAYKLIMENITANADEDDEDDDEPVVDPCHVFNPKMHSEMSEDVD